MLNSDKCAFEFNNHPPTAKRSVDVRQSRNDAIRRSELEIVIAKTLRDWCSQSPNRPDTKVHPQLSEGRRFFVSRAARQRSSVSKPLSEPVESLSRGSNAGRNVSAIDTSYGRIPNLLECLRRVDFQTAKPPSGWQTLYGLQRDELSLEIDGPKVTYSRFTRFGFLSNRRPMIIANKPLHPRSSRVVYYEIHLLHIPKQAPKFCMGYRGFAPHSTPDVLKEMSLEGAQLSFAKTDDYPSTFQEGIRVTVTGHFWGNTVGCGVDLKTQTFFYTEGRELVCKSSHACR